MSVEELNVSRAIGLTKNNAALQRWLITGPEVARLLEEFKNLHTVDEEGVLEHHDSSASVAKQSLSEVKTFLGVMNDLCNPLLYESFDPYSLDTKVVAQQNLTAEVITVKDTGKIQLLELFEITH